MKFLSGCFCFVLFETFLVSSYRILGIFPLTGRSHFLAFEPILKGLATKGHNVSVVGYFPSKARLSNYEDVVIGDQSFLFDEVDRNFLSDLHNIDPQSRLSMYATFIFLGVLGQMSCEKLFTSHAVQKFMENHDKYDIVITEYFNSDCARVLAKKINCSVVRVHSATLMPWTDNRYANPLNPAYVPNTFLPFSDKMTFWERTENTVLTLVQSIYFNVFVIRYNNYLADKVFGEVGHTLQKDIYDDSILLINAHFSLNSPRPYVPNIIEVGGVNVGNSKPLPLVSDILMATR